MYNNNIYFSLYKKVYNDTNISVIRESVYRVIQDDV